MSTVEKDSFVKIDYISKIVKTDKIFDTTVESVAKEAQIYKSDKIYEPLLLVLGTNWLPKLVQKALIGQKEKKKVEVEIGFQDGFGPHDPSKIKLVPRKEFQLLELSPRKGEWVTIQEQEGLILSVNSGKVKIDFNHKLAGKSINYKVTILNIVESTEEKMMSIVGRRLPGADLFDSVINLEKNFVKIELPRRVRYFEYIQFAKRGIAKEICELISPFEVVKFIESFDTRIDDY